MSNSEWTEQFPACRSQYLKFEGSDHRPLLSFLDTTRRKCRRIFRYDRRLRENAEVKQIVKDICDTHQHLKVERRLTLCRKAICKWSKEHHENSRKKIEELKTRLDLAMSDQNPIEGVIQELNSQLLLAYKIEEEFWKQRSRQLWLALGDANTGYFHAVTKGRRARNRLSVIEDEDGLPVFEEEKISGVICKFYDNLFTSNHFDSAHTIEKALKPCISLETNEELIKEPTPEEIRNATFAIHADKAPGPDGFSASFFQSNWEVIGPAIVTEVQRFFTTGILSPSLNETHVRLIPKTLDATKVEDYRPIALCNVYYKIISKILTMRLQPVLCNIISENQSGFVQGRVISDNVLITHEVLQYLKTSQAEKWCPMAVKTDMSKAYDRIEWEFISQVFKRLGFHDTWTQWLMQCITTVSYSLPD